MAARKRGKLRLEDYEALDPPKALDRIDGEMEEARRSIKQDPPVDDAGRAASARLIELQRIRTAITDRQMAESMSTATLEDAALIAAMFADEEAERYDHEVALALQNGGNAPVPTTNDQAATNESPELDALMLSKLAARHVSVSAAEALLFTSAAQKESESQPQRSNRDCVICLDSKPWYELLSVPCGDNYCADCLQSLFRDSYTDETLFPPKCCQQTIPIDDAEIILFLPKDLRDPYETRRIETTTNDRTYCIACGKFVLPSAITNRTATCNSCQATTCSGCKKAAHTGDCPHDENDRLMLQLAEREGWRRCIRCRRMVELTIGCYHMRCLCGAEFCYLCGRVWKTCRCPQWDEDRLLARANQVANRETPARRGEVAQVAEQLRRDHECEHRRQDWRSIDGRNRCEECHDTMPLFIYECSQCHLRVCRRCRRNRILV